MNHNLKNKNIHVRICSTEEEIINNIIQNRYNSVNNVSEAVRACINFNTVVLMGGV